MLPRSRVRGKDCHGVRHSGHARQDANVRCDAVLYTKENGVNLSLNARGLNGKQPSSPKSIVSAQSLKKPIYEVCGKKPFHHRKRAPVSVQVALSSSKLSASRNQAWQCWSQSLICPRRPSAGQNPVKKNAAKEHPRGKSCRKPSLSG